ncbi:metallophosphoesterase [Frankia sp. Cr1]|uniref:metallophosphoesterase n=1 Tax=Frankia sp. Cr1 TaxID=3073931 RepID=UPI002AD477AC|nr:metallophosphoesterase [Frankia sp. Cr1]
MTGIGVLLVTAALGTAGGAARADGYPPTAEAVGGATLADLPAGQDTGYSGHDDGLDINVDDTHGDTHGDWDGAPGPGLPVPQEAWAWTQLTDRGAEIRYVTPVNGACPFVTFTPGGSQQMTHPSPAFVSTPAAFPSTATVCTLPVPPGTTGAQIDPATAGAVTIRPTANGTVPVPKWPTTGRPAHIAVIGDTGCRVPVSGPAQNCTPEPQYWPMRGVADSAATRPTPPDLVIHVGDYIYRSNLSVPQAQTPTCGPATGGNPHTWGCLIADFFEPAANLVAQAPIVFVRGNHETCNRSGNVYFRYQADTLNATACSLLPPQYYTPPVRINAGTLGLLLLDSSCAAAESMADCNQTPQQKIDEYTAEFNRVNAGLVQQGDNFLLSHSPIWTINGVTPHGNPEWVDHNLEMSITNTTVHQLDPRINLVLSGHVHLYQMLDFGSLTSPHRPPQVTVGSSGTELDQQTWLDNQMINKDVDGYPVRHLVTRPEFGYAVLRFIPGATTPPMTSDTWNLRYFDQFGNPSTGTNCNLVGAQFPNCE